MASLISFSRTGLKDWFLQRVTAILFLIYSIFIIVMLFASTGVDGYHIWISVFNNTFVKIFTIISFLFLISHAWVGLWTVFTDYIKCKYMSALLQISMVLGFLISFVWLIIILF